MAVSPDISWRCQRWILGEFRKVCGERWAEQVWEHVAFGWLGVLLFSGSVSVKGAQQSPTVFGGPLLEFQQ